MIDGITVTPLKKIAHDKGDIFHALKCSETSFSKFGEAYFSTVKKGAVKGWKLHREMVLNLVVPVGSVRFVCFDSRVDSATFEQFFEVTLSPCNYCRLTVPNGIWMAFQGIGEGTNLLLNIASIEHDPTESTTCDLSEIAYFE
ncbi:dTDP-4-dehydrorhamnose 3,5-epimerase family protein [Thaumasiovibrio subtropicus]|uniref:dTDP-4-dehydrorhamnose 3,5-epimerase family protein n=1 Tax=Thaumasiovibrio subtropicus TaxID=1891207 RepID=UPI000B35193E|nr:dTDP-4-dehydrorhamnose 3,5-epimerase family protein [Thaumasiovibrio subtropicus]